MKEMIWHSSIEEILRDLGNEAQIKAKLHRKGYRYFHHRNLKYQLPVIVLSVISGSGNFVSAQFPDAQVYIILFIGLLSIITSIISSVSQFLKLSQLSESHRIAYLSWEKFYSNIKIQLRFKQEDRIEVKDYIRVIVSEYDRLNEISPVIPKQYLVSETKKIQKQQSDKNVKIPYFMNGINCVSIYGNNSPITKLEEQMYKKNLYKSQTDADKDAKDAEDAEDAEDDEDAKDAEDDNVNLEISIPMDKLNKKE
jgi:hypothetical protein